MTSKVSAIVLSLVLALVWATTAGAQGKMERYPVTGTYQLQIGDGLPIPIATPANAVAGANVLQPVAQSDPKSIQFSGGEFVHPGTPTNLPLNPLNNAVFQVRTAIEIAFPKLGATLKPGGRTGAPVVHWCAGVDITPTGTGGCLTPGDGPSIHGKITYTATGAQFGGVARGATGGAADVALKAGVVGVGGCDYNQTATCLVIFALATPAGTVVGGGPFNASVTTQGSAQPDGLFQAIIGPVGTVLALKTPAIGPGQPNPATSVGGPWTTGMLSLTNTAADPPEIFTMQGSDNRVNGVGTISLVTGAMSSRLLSGPNANRGWLMMTIGEPAEDLPALGTWGIGALAIVLAGVATRRLRKQA